MARCARSGPISLFAAALLAAALAPSAGAQQLEPAAGGETASAGRSGGQTVPPGGNEGNWVTPTRTFEGTRYSPLKAITTDNVKGLKEAWSYVTGIKDGHEGQPLVINNTMYAVTPYPDKLVAFDLTRPGPAVKWTYAPPIDPASFGKACCDDVNRGRRTPTGRSSTTCSTTTPSRSTRAPESWCGAPSSTR